MEMTFRWFGPDDPIPLAHVRQIPGVQGVVSALYDVPVGAEWPREKLERLAATIDAAGLRLSVVELNNPNLYLHGTRDVVEHGVLDHRLGTSVKVSGSVRLRFAPLMGAAPCTGKHLHHMRPQCHQLRGPFRARVAGAAHLPRRLPQEHDQHSQPDLQGASRGVSWAPPHSRTAMLAAVVDARGDSRLPRKDAARAD